MMDDKKELDDEVAALTDDLLEGRQPKTTMPEADELGSVARQIQRTIAPDKPTSPIFRDRLEMRLNLEWNRVYPRRQRFWTQRQFQYAAAAASVVLVAGILALTLTKQGNDLLQAATGGQASPVIIAAIVAGIMLGAVLLFLRLRR